MAGFHILTIVNNAAVSIDVQVSLQVSALAFAFFFFFAHFQLLASVSPYQNEGFFWPHSLPMYGL